MTRTIVLTIDLDDENSWRKALPTAIDHAKHMGASLHALTIVPDNLIRMTAVAQVIPEGFEQKLIDDAAARLSALLQAEAPADFTIEQAVRHGGIHQEILRYCDDVGADLIVMASHQPALKDYLLGPNAAHIVRHARCSVWVVRG